MDTDGRFYFMEANTRLQVEHPVTEMVTGIDIVKEQIRIAAGERLAFKQNDITFTGHSIECRINAEDPDTFVPSPGVIHVFSVPGGPGVRVETFAHSECTISPYYDLMIAKIIVHSRDRPEALREIALDQPVSGLEARRRAERRPAGAEEDRPRGLDRCEPVVVQAEGQGESSRGVRPSSRACASASHSRYCFS